MIRIFNFRSEINPLKLFTLRNVTQPKRSIFAQTEITMPLEIMVAVGKRFVVGIAELGDKTATIEKPIIPFLKLEEPEEVAKELLRKLGIPESEWDRILKTKKEITI